MAVFAVLPTYNRKAPLAACLKALTRQSVQPVVIVGDSGSTDGTADMVETEFPAAIRCAGSAEMWWTAATNLGVREALRRAGPNDHILCINDDVLVEPDYVERLMACAAAPRRIVGSVSTSVSDPGKIRDGGVRINWWTAGSFVQNQGRPLSDFRAGHIESVSVLPGRGTLFPVAAFRELGLFPEAELPHYAADYAFTARCARAGYELVVCYDAVVRSRTEMTGMHAARRRLSLREFHRFFFSRRSSANIGDRFHYAWIARRNAIQAMVFFFCNLLRLAYHYAANVDEPQVRYDRGMKQ
jgi:GT2 family glycosyltransferase